MSKHVFIIAEAGVNHNGSIALAKKMIDVAKNAGADAVKFQTYISEKCISVFAPKADYQLENTGSKESQLEMVKKLELSFEQFIELKHYCDSIGIEFLSTAFDIDSVRFLDSIGMRIWKIPSGEITNAPLLIEFAKTGKPIILSTGMAAMDEIHWTVDFLRKNGCGDISILHCNTEYPTPFEDVNLLAMDSIRKEFSCEVGYSDHTKGVEVPVAAVARGAAIIEKHFTLDRNMEGPDHKASLEPAELKAMVEAIRNIERAIGDGVKKPSASEQSNINIARKSIVALCDIKKGDVLTETNITVKRPGNGISAKNWFDVLGKTAIRDFSKDEMIEL